MRTQIIQEHDLPRNQRRRQHVLEVGRERHPVDSTADDQAGTDTLIGHAGNCGRGERRVARHGCHGTLSDGRPSMGRREIEVAADLVHDH